MAEPLLGRGDACRRRRIARGLCRVTALLLGARLLRVRLFPLRRRRVLVPVLLLLLPAQPARLGAPRLRSGLGLGLRLRLGLGLGLGSGLGLG